MKKVVYIKTIYGDFVWQDEKMIPCRYGDFEINKDASEKDLEDAKKFMEEKHLTCDSINLMSLGEEIAVGYILRKRV